MQIQEKAACGRPPCETKSKMQMQMHFQMQIHWTAAFGRRPIETKSQNTMADIMLRSGCPWSPTNIRFSVSIEHCNFANGQHKNQKICMLKCLLEIRLGCILDARKPIWVSRAQLECPQSCKETTGKPWVPPAAAYGCHPKTPLFTFWRGQFVNGIS